MSGFAPAFPVQCGSFRRYPADRLAARVIDAVSLVRKRDKAGELIRYAVCIDLAGRVSIDRMADRVPDHVATVTLTSCPDWLADELDFEWRSRNA
jgi:hypothetical protein